VPQVYPDLPRRRHAAIATDVTTVVLIVVFALVGNVVHDAIADLRSVGEGITGAGRAIDDSGRHAGGALRDSLGSAADTVGGTPIVGGTLSGALRSAGDGAAGQIERGASEPAQQVIEAGREAQRRTLRTARIIGWTVFGLPTALLLLWIVPRRVFQIRDLTAARRALDDPHRDAERVRVLAQRAAFALPFGALLRHTPDPMGDLVAGRHDRLLAALGEDVGLRITRPPR
jgi:hypothetical protein